MRFSNHGDPEKLFKYNNLNLFVGSRRELENGGFIKDATSWKMSHLVNPNTQQFTGLSFGEFTAISRANCEQGYDHSAPDESCDCGFYAFREMTKAIDVTSHSRALVLLRVGLYGKIVEHDYGYRAEEQQIEALFFNSKCSKLLCYGKTVGIIAGRGKWRNICEKHVTPSFISIEKIRYMFKIEVGTFNRRTGVLESIAASK